MKYMVLIKHKKNCLGIHERNLRGHPWAAIPAKNFGAGRDGFLMGSARSPLSRGSKQWMVFICNSSGCPGRIAVNMSEIMADAPVGCRAKQ